MQQNPIEPHPQQDHHDVAHFVSQVRRRLDLHRLAYGACLIATVVGILLVIVGLIYVLQGYRVPPAWYPVMGVVGMMAMAVYAWLGRVATNQAARYADQFFGLKDAVRSTLGFAGREDDFCKLQAAQASQTVKMLKPSAIPFAWPRRTILAGVCLLALACVLGLMDESQSVRDAREQKQLVLDRTLQINTAVQELAQQLLEIDDSDLDAQTHEALNQLKEQALELKPQQDMKIAMKQYARLEQQVQQMVQQMDTRPAEKMLARIGEQLKDNPQHRQLGQQLSAKQFKQAQQTLQQHKQDHRLSKEQQRQALNRLKSLSTSMARASESASRSGSSSSSNSNNTNANASGMSGQISQSIAELEKFADALEKAQQKEGLDQNQSPQNKDTSASACKSCNSALGKLGQCMSKLSGQRKLNQQLSMMRKSLSQCQSFLCQSKSQCQSLSQSLAACQKPGLKAGTASSGMFNRIEQSLMASGALDQLLGQKGDGTSTKTTEQANDGQGVSSKARRTIQRDYANALESFVQREDVPVPVRTGVKQYFQQIHEMDHEVIRDSN